MGESKPTHSEACCEYCGRPLAPCVVEFGARRIVAGFRECDCEGARGQRARAERMEAAKREARLAERRKRAGIPKRFLGATVQHQDLIDYLESFEGSAGRGLYIYGSVGRGEKLFSRSLGERLRGRRLPHGVHNGIGDAREDQGELLGERGDRFGHFQIRCMRRPRPRRPRQRGCQGVVLEHDVPCDKRPIRKHEADHLHLELLAPGAIEKAWKEGRDGDRRGYREPALGDHHPHPPHGAGYEDCVKDVTDGTCRDDGAFSRRRHRRVCE